MKELNKIDIAKLKSKIKERPLFYCKCGLSKRLPYCDGRHGCEPAAGKERGKNK
ncbi:MAG: CDGSH iron-sulfur domain-containing protein [bacterium]